MPGMDDVNALVIWNILKLYNYDLTGFDHCDCVPVEICEFLSRRPSMPERQKALVELLTSIIRDDHERFKGIFDTDTASRERQSEQGASRAKGESRKRKSRK